MLGGHFYAQLGGNSLAKYYFAISDTPVLEQGGYGLTNFRLSFSPAGDKLVQSYPGAPRWFKVHVSHHFGEASR